MMMCCKMFYPKNCSISFLYSTVNSQQTNFISAPRFIIQKADSVSVCHVSLQSQRTDPFFCLSAFPFTYSLCTGPLLTCLQDIKYDSRKRSWTIPQTLSCSELDQCSLAHISVFSRGVKFAGGPSVWCIIAEPRP